ncbi:unnamed protein product [Calicophoron daubneyi]|uniref:Aldehyde dehydrogenase domain-containing protein n=1 Tax=Calicophoron daubneyi TaxID=300641 RepID=A0AAV2TSY0_CALDB
MGIFSSRYESVQLGSASNLDSTVFDLSGPEMRYKILDYIGSGKKEGARLVTGRNRIGKQGYFIQPNAFANVTDEMKIAREEIFGPVQSILRLETEKEVIRRVNATHYRLGSGMFMSDMGRAVPMDVTVEAESFLELRLDFE